MEVFTPTFVYNCSLVLSRNLKLMLIFYAKPQNFYLKQNTNFFHFIFYKMSILCSICQGDINFHDEEISILHCGHIYHQNCVQQWLDTRMTCPDCRSQVVRENVVMKIYPSINGDADIVYQGSSDETKNILQVFNKNNTNFQKLLIKRITFLEERNKDYSKKNLKLDENLRNTLKTMRELQNEKIINDEKTNKLNSDNEKLKKEIKSLEEKLISISNELSTCKKQDETEFDILEAENTNLKNKLASVLDILLSEECISDTIQSTSKS